MFEIWKVEIHEQGRHGTVVYRERKNEVRFYWEFGGGDVVAMLQAPGTSTWDQNYPWAAGRRDEILQRAAEGVIKQKCKNCRAEMDAGGKWILLRSK